MFKNDISTWQRFLLILLAVALVVVPSAAYGTTWLNVKNNATSTLTSTMTAGSTSFTVTTNEGALFPATNFPVTIDDEIILVSSRSSDNFTIGTRGYASTTAAAHAIGAAVNLNVIAEFTSQLQSAVDNITLNLTTNYLPKFNGTGLVNSSVSDNGTHTVVSDNLAVTGSITGSNIPAGKTPVTTDNTSLNSTITNTAGISRSGTTTTISDNLTVGTMPVGNGNTTLCQYWLSADQGSIPNSAIARVELDTSAFDLGSNFSTGDLYGASGAYTQADSSGCTSTNIKKTGASFSNILFYSKVRWGSNAAGDANVGTGYVSAVPSSDNLTIVKATGADFANSYYFWIHKNHYVVPTTGYYFVYGFVRYNPVESSVIYRSYITNNGPVVIDGNQHSTLTGAIGVQPTAMGILYLTAGDLIGLTARTQTQSVAYTVVGAASVYSSLTIMRLQ